MAVAREAGLDVAIVEGEEENIKLTWPADFARAISHLGGTMDRIRDIRLGNGYDVHAFTDRRSRLAVRREDPA